MPRSANSTSAAREPSPKSASAPPPVTRPDEQTASQDVGAAPAAAPDGSVVPRPGGNRRPHRDVVPGLPRTQTLARQQAEQRENLMPVRPTPDERRATSMDRRLLHSTMSPSASQRLVNPRSSAPNVGFGPRRTVAGQLSRDASVSREVVPPAPDAPSLRSEPSVDGLATEEATGDDVPSDVFHPADRPFLVDTASMTSSQYEQTILHELEFNWILNLSMHFRDKSRREKFFITYRQQPDLWRRVTVSLDYRDAPEDSLEMDLLHTKFQRDKNEKIYEAIRESLSSIQFYDTVTNLKLQTTDGRLHVHVVEDVTEIIKYPTIRMVQHLGCRVIREREIEFDSHMSGFVYKVRVDGRMLIKKEIPGPDSVDEFLYEVNALSFLSHSRNVIEFFGVIMDDNDCVTGLLISYAEQGALIDILYDSDHGIPWPTRAKWARQIVQGLSEIHEAGYVQGDFTLSNIVIDDDGNAKIIDINRRGCPVGWEPPEATPLIENKQRISMYIGVKSDLYQLGMVLWALTMQDDEPEAHARPLHLAANVAVPSWFRTIVETCLDEDPRARAQARQLVRLFPVPDGRSEKSDFSDYDDVDWEGDRRPPVPYIHDNRGMRPGDDALSFQHGVALANSVSQTEDAGICADSFPADGGMGSSSDWSYVNVDHVSVGSASRLSNEPAAYHKRGRSPPNPNRRHYHSSSYQSSSGRQVSPGDGRSASRGVASTSSAFDNVLGPEGLLHETHEAQVQDDVTVDAGDEQVASGEIRGDELQVSAPDESESLEEQPVSGDSSLDLPAADPPATDQPPNVDRIKAEPVVDVPVVEKQHTDQPDVYMDQSSEGSSTVDQSVPDSEKSAVAQQRPAEQKQIGDDQVIVDDDSLLGVEKTLLSRSRRYWPKSNHQNH